MLVVVGCLCIPAANSAAIEWGDCDEDGVVRLADVLLLLRHIHGTQRLMMPNQIYACDVSGGGGPAPSPDGEIFVDDLLFIVEKARGAMTF
jgi:hypothetical protein